MDGNITTKFEDSNTICITTWLSIMQASSC